MFRISLTNEPNQKHTVVLPSGETFSITLRIVPMQQGWFITELTYKTFTLNGVRICNSPNMLHQWKNEIPFGLACQSVADREPSLSDDFSSGVSNLYLLTQEEVAAYSEFLSG